MILLGFYKLTYVRGVKFIMIEHDSSAVIVDKWMDIRRITTLYNLNYHFYDCCEETGDIMYFLQKPDKYFVKIREKGNLYLYGNSTIKKSWTEYLNQLKTKPTHYIYSLSIPLNYQIDSVLNVLSSKEYIAMLPFNYDNNLHVVKVRYKLRNVNLENFKNITEFGKERELKIKSICNNDLISVNSSVNTEITGKEKNILQFDYSVIFKTNTSMMDFSSKIVSEKFEIINIQHMNDQIIWLLDKRNNLDVVGLEIKSKFGFVDTVRYK